MNKNIRVSALLLSVLLLCVALTSCIGGGGLSGTYSDIEGELSEDLGEVFVFRGNRYTYTLNAFGEVLTEFSGTYYIEDGKLTIFSSESFVGGALDMRTGKYFKTCDFEKGDGYIKIDEVIFYKK